MVRTDTHPEEISERPNAEAASTLPTNQIDSEKPRNIILFIADGLGLAHLTAAQLTSKGIETPSAWDRFEVEGLQTTHPSWGILTDSAASATSMATGRVTYPSAVGVDPQGEPLETLLERATGFGYRTGIVTDSYVWDATPAAFASHAADRDDAAQILEQLGQSQLDVLFGELEDVGEDGVPSWEESELLLSHRFKIYGPANSEVETIRTVGLETPVAALFEEDQMMDLESSPNLPTLVDIALDRLVASGEPFVLLVEGEEVDSASHRNDFTRMLAGMRAIEASLERLLDFAESRTDTLLVFASDHETGGLSLGSDRYNRTLSAMWETKDHTAVPVPVMASGPGAKLFAGTQPNWQVGQRLNQLLVELP